MAEVEMFNFGEQANDRQLSDALMALRKSDRALFDKLAEILDKPLVVEGYA